MGKCHQSVGGVEVTLNRAVVSLEGPKREQDIAINTELGLDPVKNPVIALCVAAPTDDPVI